MAHTQHGDKDRKKRKMDCPSPLTLTIPPLIVSLFHQVGLTTTYCQPWPAVFPTPTQAISTATPAITCNDQCAWGWTDFTGIIGDPIWQVDIYTCDTASPRDYLLEIYYTPAYAPGVVDFYYGAWHLVANPTPAGIYHSFDPTGSGHLCQIPDLIAVATP